MQLSTTIAKWLRDYCSIFWSRFDTVILQYVTIYIALLRKTTLQRQQSFDLYIIKTSARLTPLRSNKSDYISNCVQWNKSLDEHVLRLSCMLIRPSILSKIKFQYDYMPFCVQQKDFVDCFCAESSSQSVFNKDQEHFFDTKVKTFYEVGQFSSISNSTSMNLKMRK